MNAKCDACGTPLQDFNSLQRHIRRFHKVSSSIPKILCGLCDAKFFTNLELETHMGLKHDLEAEHEILTFNNEDDFHQWRRDVEADLKVKYVRKSCRKSSDKSIVYYVCYRSGQPRLRVSDENRKRRLKLTGSRKTGSQCLSRITVTFFVSGSVVADFCKTHCGHAVELEHPPISSPMENEMASEISAVIPVDERVRGYATDTLTSTNQDLYNILKEFSLDSEWERDTDDAASVAAWVQKERESDETSCVILFKPKGFMPPEFAHLQDEHESKKGLKTEDFLLAIMTRDQEEVLKRFSDGGIFSMDSTHGTKSCGYELTTLMVLDDLQNGFPVAFFISNRQDSMGIELFLESVMERHGPINGKTFMSEMANTFYTGWCSVMGECEFRLFSPWHVIRAWQRKIKELIQIDAEREDTFARINALLSETDERTFEEMLSSVVHQLCENELTSRFGNYFKNEYTRNVHQWAYCHSKYAGIDTGMNLERLQSSINYVFLKGKAVKRLEHTIHALMRLIDWKVHDRILVSENGKFRYKVRQLQKRHTASASLSVDNVVPGEPGMWYVFSSANPMDSVRIRLNELNCVCRLSCEHCKSCIHAYYCTCIDYCIKNNMCKHVHLLCRFLSCQVVEEESDPLGVDDPPAMEEEPQELAVYVKQENPETKALVNRLQRGKKRQIRVDVVREKKKLEEAFYSLLNDIQSTRGAEALRRILKQAAPIVKAADGPTSQNVNVI